MQGLNMACVVKNKMKNIPNVLQTSSLQWTIATYNELQLSISSIPKCKMWNIMNDEVKEER